MPRNQHLQRRLERTLHSLNGMHEEGLLPPALQPLLALAPPRGATVEVTMLDGGSGPANGNGAAADEIRIAFREHGAESNDHQSEGDPMVELIEVLAQAERSPQLRFVALKFLRDRLLPQTQKTWAQSPQSCQALIAEAIDKGILLTSKTPNPRNPDFPVTAVHLDHTNPTVAAATKGEATPATTPPVETPQAGARVD